jgi:hypothetical protein
MLKILRVSAQNTVAWDCCTHAVQNYGYDTTLRAVSYLILLTTLFLKYVAKTKSKTRYCSKIAQDKYRTYECADNVNTRDLRIS